MTSYSVVYRPRKELYRCVIRGRRRGVRVGILMPIPYAAASCSLFLHYVYTYLCESGVEVYRFFYNTDQNVVETPDGMIDPRRLDILLVSLPYELDYVYAIRAMRAMGIDIPRRERHKPIVVAGGLAPSANPLPLIDIADAVVIGEGEDFIYRIVEGICTDEDDYKTCIDRIEDLKYVYSRNKSKSFEKVKRYVVQNLDESYHPTRYVFSIDEEPVYGVGVLLELSRGCPRLCAFCMESHVMYPFRYRSLNRVVEIIEEGSRNLGVKRVIFYSLAIFDIPYTDKLLRALLECGYRASIPSLRPDYINEDRIEVIKALGQNTITIAPESFVYETCRRIGKVFDVDKLSEAVVYALDKAGFRHVKLYLILGFPWSSDFEKEINSVVEVVKNIISRCSRRRRAMIRITVNPLIPKPWTPFRRYPPSYVLKLSDVVYKCSQRLRELGKAVEVDVYPPEWGFVQAVIALGNENISRVLIEWSEKSLTPSVFKSLVGNIEYVHKGWRECDPPWEQIIDVGINPKYFDAREKSFSYV